MTYGGVEQRWVLIESQERKTSDLKKLRQKVEQESRKFSKEIARLVKEGFDQQSSAISKMKAIESQLKYHQIDEIKVSKYQTKDEKDIYKICGQLRENQELIAENQNQAGRFILATNILDIRELDASEILRIYKQQQ